MQKTNVCWRNVASKNTDNSKAYPGFKKKNVNTCRTQDRSDKARPLFARFTRKNLRKSSSKGKKRLEMITVDFGGKRGKWQI